MERVQIRPRSLGIPRLRPRELCPDGPSWEEEAQRAMAGSGLHSALTPGGLAGYRVLSLALDSALLVLRAPGSLGETECLQ